MHWWTDEQRVLLKMSALSTYTYTSQANYIQGKMSSAQHLIVDKKHHWTNLWHMAVWQAELGPNQRIQKQRRHLLLNETQEYKHKKKPQEQETNN